MCGNRACRSARSPHLDDPGAPPCPVYTLLGPRMGLPSYLIYSRHPGDGLTRRLIINLPVGLRWTDGFAGVVGCVLGNELSDELSGVSEVSLLGSLWSEGAALV